MRTFSALLIPTLFAGGLTLTAPLAHAAEVSDCSRAIGQVTADTAKSVSESVHGDWAASNKTTEEALGELIGAQVACNLDSNQTNLDAMNQKFDTTANDMTAMLAAIGTKDRHSPRLKGVLTTSAAVSDDLRSLAEYAN